MDASNQVIILTPAGAAALAVVRIAGEGVPEFLARHFSRPISGGRALHGELRDAAGNAIDDPVVTRGKGNSADICLHGGPWVIEATLSLLRSAGFEISAAEGRLPEFAVDADDPIERDVLRELPSATTELGVRALLHQPAAWRRIFLDAGLDVHSDWDRLWAGDREVLERLPAAGVARDDALWRLLNPSTIAIVGEPNVGKSTLANRLLAAERSIVADLPGTTRDWVGETCDLDGLPILLVDTPGLRDSSDAIEQAAIAQSQSIIKSADLVVRVIDATCAKPQQPQGNVEIIVANKIDLAAAPSRFALGISALTGEGVHKLISEIHRRFGVLDFDPTAVRAWTKQQVAILTTSA